MWQNCWFFQSVKWWKCWENSGFFHILYQYSITSYIKNFNETGKMTQWIGSYLPLRLMMTWVQFLEPRWWREDLSCPLISMWVESTSAEPHVPSFCPRVHSLQLSAILNIPFPSPSHWGPKLSIESSRLPTVSLVYKIQRNFPAKNCSFIPGCDTLTSPPFSMATED